MRVRSWLIRGFILAGVAAIVALAWVANSWVSPERVRANVVATLTEQFDDVDVHVGSARMRLLGGIAVTDLRLTRRGDPANQPFLNVPNAILYHDKEQLNRGRLVIRKVELDNPTLRVDRSADGKWNLAEVMKPGPADKPVPTFVVKGGVVIFNDRTPGAIPATTFTDVRMTLLNDPLPTLTVQLTANAKEYGPVNIRGRLNRINRQLSLSFEMAEFPIGEAAVMTAQRFAPELAPHLAKLNAVANVKADLTYTPDAATPWRHDVRFDVKNAKFSHPELPWPIEKITATVRSLDGRVKVDDATAEIGTAKLRVSLETRADTPAKTDPQPPATDDPMRSIEDRLQRLEITATSVALDEELFSRLPPKLKRTQKMFNPSGHVDLAYKFARETLGWKRDLEFRPKQASMMYEKFRYPVADVRGLVKSTVTHAGGESTTIDLVGTAAGQLITIKGRVEGDGPDPAINFRVTGTNLPIDETLYAALPPKYSAFVREFRASGRGDVIAEITQQQGVNLAENEYRIEVKDGKLNYTAFPYTLEKLKGRLIVRTTATDPTRPLRPGEPIRPLPDRDEFILDGFTATHAGAAVWMHGSKRPMPDSRDRKLTMHLGANNLPLDSELQAALTLARFDDVWNNFSPRGKLTFTADVELIDRTPVGAKPEQEKPIDFANDLKFTVGFSGPTITPKFFPYEMSDVAGWLEYKQNRVDLAHFAARHGSSRMKLAAGEVRFYPDGAVWANLGGMEMKPCVLDDDLKKALPGKLGFALDELKLKGGAELLVKHLVVSAPPDPSGAIRNGPIVNVANVTPRPDPVVYWDAELKLYAASFDTGVPWDDVYGSLACRGRYEGTHLGAIRGNVWLDRAFVSRLPVTVARCQLRAEPQSPDPARKGEFLPTTLQFLNVAGDLFHGALGGQARVVLTEATRYEVWLTATDVQLEEVARHYKLGSDADLKGIAQAQLLLFNKPDPKTGQLVVEGTGKVDVPTGRMYNLPILLDLVKVLKLQAPDKTAFEEAHVVFRVQGDRIKVDQLDLIGKAICLGGAGELDTSGDYVKFEFYTVWSQVLKQMINTPVGDLTAFLSKNLFTIKMVRENGELKYKPEPVPIVTEPAKAVLDRLKRGAGKLMGK